MRTFILICLAFAGNLLYSQPHVPEGYFQSPLEIPLVLSGTFGELRPNHFHSGLDIKTQHREGLKVLAAAKGYVSRINIQHFGYGKALYVQHPNGYTTVYAHLKRFSPEIEAYVKKRQYANQTYEIELFPQAGELPVSAGDLVALSGNTGGSGGPHLHFEIRDENQRPMNPKLFGMSVADSRPPIIHSVYAYPLDQESHVNNSARRQRIRLTPLADGSFLAQKINACGNIGFGISTVDQQNMAPNRNGVYQVESSLNGEKVFGIHFNRFSFANSRHLNQLIDYEYYSKHNLRIQKLFVEPGNPLGIYEEVVSEGKLNIRDSLEYTYSISVRDFAGNQRLIRIPIQGKHAIQIQPKEDTRTDHLVRASKGFSAKERGMDLYIPPGSLYKDTYLDIAFEGDTLKLHRDEIPIHKNITLGFDVSRYSPEDRKKLFIGRLGYAGKPIYSTTYKKGDRMTTGIRTFGDYTLAADITPPKVSPVNFYNGQWISTHKDLRVKITDDLSGIRSYRATVNGKFILMEYEYKDNLLRHDFEDAILTETENDLKLEVTDNVGNTTIYEAKFFRKP